MKKAIFGWLIGFVGLIPNLVTADISIVPRVSVGMQFTDNLFLSEGNEESDCMTTITPGLSFNLSERAAGLAIDYAPSYTMYRDQDDSDYWAHVARLNGWWQVSRHFRVELTNSYLRTQDPVTEEDLTIRRTHDVYTRNTTTTRLSYQFGAQDSVYVSGEYGLLENDDPEVEDNKRYGGSAGITYWFNARWGLDVGGGLYQAEYDDGLDDYREIRGNAQLNRRFNPHVTGFLRYAHTSHQADDEREDDYAVHDGGIGFTYAFDPTMELTMSAHYMFRDVDGGDNDSSFPVNIDFTKRFQHGVITLSGEGGYEYTSLAAENIGAYRHYTVGVTGDYAFTARLSGDIHGVYSNRDYEDTRPHRKEDVFRVGCGISFQMTRWVSMRAGYTYRAIDSTVDTNDYTENRVSLMFTLSPPHPYRF